MKNSIVVIITTIIIFLTLLVSPAFAGELYTLTLNTDPFNCNNKLQDIRWINEGPPIKIKQLTVWIGAQTGTIADIAACVYKVSTGTLLAAVGWDHYGNPKGLHQWTQDFGDNWVTIGTGDAISLQSFCNGFNGRSRKAHAQAWVYYLMD